VQKDVTRLCTAIQALTSNIVPVVKVLDYFPEDIDAMQKELEMWHSEMQLNAATLETEERSNNCICLVFIRPSLSLKDWFPLLVIIIYVHSIFIITIIITGMEQKELLLQRLLKTTFRTVQILFA